MKENNQQEGVTVDVSGAPKATTLTPEVPETLTQEPVKVKKKEDLFKKMFDSTGKISIKPFIDPEKENMGLEDYGMVVFPGIFHEEQLAAIDRHGVIRFITGLDEFAPEVQRIADEEKKQAVILNIRNIVAHLEKMLATNVIKVEDEDFWDKVKLLRPDNHEFWEKISLRCGNEPMYLNPKEDPYDLIKMVAIEAGGFDLVAKSYEDAMAKPVPPRFYFDKEVHTVSTKTTYKKLRNKAIGLLDGVAGKSSKKLMYITKVLDVNSTSYKNHTPVDIMYEVLDDFINGQGVESDKSKAAQRFIDTAKMSMEDLKLRALVKDASFYKVISPKADGMLYHTATATMLGRNVSDVVEYLKSPVNEDMLVKVLSEIEKYWND